MKRVIIESPYAGDVDRNLIYLRRCIRDALRRGEAPFASHAIYTLPGVLDDDIPDEREHGIEAGRAWWIVADAILFYTDYGFSKGMDAARKRLLSIPEWMPAIEYREIGTNP